MCMYVSCSLIQVNIMISILYKLGIGIDPDGPSSYKVRYVKLSKSCAIVTSGFQKIDILALQHMRIYLRTSSPCTSNMSISYS